MYLLYLLLCHSTISSIISDCTLLRDILAPLQKSQAYVDAVFQNGCCAANSPINCSATGITKIVGMDAGLAGPLSERWMGFPELRSLNLRGNALSGPISVAFFGCQTLVELELDGNQLTGTISPNVGVAGKFEILGFASNRLTGQLPASLGNLLNMTNFQVGDNQLTGTLPTELSNLSKLSILVLSFNQFTGEIPRSFTNLSSLVVFDIQGNKLSGPLPNIFSAGSRDCVLLPSEVCTDGSFTIPLQCGTLPKCKDSFANTNASSSVISAIPSPTSISSNSNASSVSKPIDPLVWILLILLVLITIVAYAGYRYYQKWKLTAYEPDGLEAGSSSQDSFYKDSGTLVPSDSQSNMLGGNAKPNKRVSFGRYYLPQFGIDLLVDSPPIGSLRYSTFDRSATTVSAVEPLPIESGAFSTIIRSKQSTGSSSPGSSDSALPSLTKIAE